MLILAFLGLYVAVAATLAYLGRQTVIGPIIIFLAAMFFTPLVPAIYVLVARLENGAVPVRRP